MISTRLPQARAHVRSALALLKEEGKNGHLPVDKDLLAAVLVLEDVAEAIKAWMAREDNT